MKFLFLIVIYSMLSGCCKDCSKPCQNTGYAFLAESSFSPQSLSYSIGDTIYLSSTINKIQQDQTNPNLTVNYGNSVGITGNLFLLELDTITKSGTTAGLKFSVIAKTGTVTPIQGDGKKALIFNTQN